MKCIRMQEAEFSDLQETGLVIELESLWYNLCYLKFGLVG